MRPSFLLVRQVPIRACNFFCDCCDHYVCICTTGLQAYEIGKYLVCERCVNSGFPRGISGPYGCSQCYHMQLNLSKWHRQELTEGLRLLSQHIPTVLLPLVGHYAASPNWQRFEPKLNLERSLKIVTGRARKRRERRRRCQLSRYYKT
jgi:hypothetical protein